MPENVRVRCTGVVSGGGVESKKMREKTIMRSKVERE
jgi:hypothetical protein